MHATQDRVIRDGGMMYRLVLIALFLLGWGGGIQAQDAAMPLPHTATSHRQTFLHAGPGHTFVDVATLNPGIPVEIVERNSSGTWLRVRRYASDGRVALDGWVMTGYLNLSPELNYAQIPVNLDLADADSSRVNSQSMSRLYAVPIIPTISDTMVSVFWRGQAFGNQPNVITKVGDSLSATDQYLSPFSAPEYELGPYDFLEPTLLYYGASTAQDSVAAQIGLSTYVVFDPLWADDEICEPNETPLACEYRTKRPSVAFIMFGPNDVRSMTETEYAAQMRLIVEESLLAGVIPVLFTFSTHEDEAFFWQSINFNLELVAIAEEYSVPLINLWSAARPLPQFGLDEDRVHLAHSGFNTLKYDTGHETWYGVSLQNLLALRTLHNIRLTLGLGDYG